uniref:Uncharacterized protein n=1 Tax=Setaria italica TaxID=4555 RepID=K3XUF7_SETIT
MIERCCKELLYILKEPNMKKKYSGYFIKQVIIVSIIPTFSL